MKEGLTLRGRPAVNMALEPTPQSAPKIIAILAAGFSSNGLPIYRCGAA